MKRFIPLIALVLALAVTSIDARAQFDLGAHLGYDLGDVEELFLGAEGRFSLGMAFPVIINPSLQYFFVGEGGPYADFSFIEIDINGLYEFGIDNQMFTPYVGAGLGIGRTSIEVDLGPLGSSSTSDTDVGINILGGAVFGSGPLRPYAQARIKLGGDFDLTTLQGGILYRLGG